MTQRTNEAQSTAPWRDRRFVVFATGNLVNNLGEAAYKVGLPLFVYELTGSLATMSLLAALSPAVLLLSPWLGAIVDRWGPRVFVVPGLLLQVVGAVALNVSVLGGLPSATVLFCLAALVQLGGEMYRAGWIAGVPTMFPRSAARSRAVLSSLFVTSNIVGPLLVAVGVGTVGYLGLLWFNAASFLAPIVVWLLGVHPPAKERVPRDAESGRRPGLGRDILHGWRIVRAEKRVLYVQLTSLPLHFVSGVGVLSFMVWYLRDHWDMSASGVSTAQAVANIGALVGSVYIAARARPRPRAVLALSAIVMTAALFLMALPSPAAFVVCMVAFFTLRSAMTAVTAMIIVKYLPSEVVGRAEGLFNLMSGLPILAAPLLIPLVQRAAGSTAVLLFLGLASAVSLLCLLRFWPSWSDETADPGNAAPGRTPAA
ncbi:MFS transporter [Streptomyces alkaliterrae]|uniref:MFS transporter n=1 Tax=Streptomyces alkaliterrae TaxID=2213162 RepID=A0A5P0YPN5_9ACTN|nr:MFS transporter [Streptomyces alkaliterrae]MBB1261292.1 MFS transporter [Streptomyces alkaliterrae]MQS02324.1 MFS transporter [Streptomyces alkaliterrae]